MLLSWNRVTIDMLTVSKLTFVGDYLPDTDFICPEAISRGAIIANLECVIGPSDQRRAKAHSVMLPPSAITRVANSGVAAFNLANNHVYDAGSDVFDAMLCQLDALPGIQFYGLKQRPYAVIQRAGLSSAIIGSLEPCRSRGPRLMKEEDIADLIRTIRNQFDRVYVTPHWGKEGELACHPSPRQRRLARSWIDAGADGIFGHHSHTIHGMELLNSRPVYYSLGNYQFDHVEGRRYPLAACGLVVTVTHSVEGNETNEVFVRQHKNSLDVVDDKTRGLLEQHLESISADIDGSTGPWSAVRWARHVGHVYMTKNNRSWSIRLRRNFFKTLPIWIVWLFLPQTMLMRFGRLFSDRAFTIRHEAINLKMRGSV